MYSNYSIHWAQRRDSGVALRGDSGIHFGEVADGRAGSVVKGILNCISMINETHVSR